MNNFEMIYQRIERLRKAAQTLLAQKKLERTQRIESLTLELVKESVRCRDELK